MPNTMTTFSFGPAAGSAIACPVRVTDRDGNPWFVLADVCNALGIENPTRSASGLDEDEKASLHNVKGVPGFHGAQSVTIVSEAGLYSLILRSRKPLARAFKRWVTHTVLPTLRKEGAYVVGEEGLTAPGMALEDIDALNDHIISLLRHKADLLEKRVEEQKAVIHENLEMVTMDAHEAHTHRYFTRSYKGRLSQLATHMAQARGITLEKQPRKVRGRDGEMHDTSVNIYPRALLEDAERALAEADRVLEEAA